jgi:hypothetical protein
MPFSPSLENWLAENKSFVNDTFAEDLQGGRSLGPASGVLWDAYPFLHRCQYSGLFAGMSLSGIRNEEIEVYVEEYSAKHGFVPATGGPFAGDGWQELSGDQWQKINPDFSPSPVSPPHNPVDMILSVGNQHLDTRGWRYKRTQISNKYQQHSWIGEGYCLLVVTFGDRPEHIAPFLRPCFVSGRSARIDPHCLYVLTPQALLFEGRVVLRSEEPVNLSAQGASIKVSKASSGSAERLLRQISGLFPNVVGNFSCSSDGCHRFTQPCAETDITSEKVELEKAEITLQNACTPCCHCQDYMEHYETLRDLTEKYAALIGQFAELYAKSITIKEQLKNFLQTKYKLIQVRMGEWGNDKAGLFCTLLVTVTATEALKPQASAKRIFFQEDMALVVASARLTVQAEGLTIVAAVSPDGAGILLKNIAAQYIGGKTVKILIRFQTFAGFDPSKIKARINGTV